MKDVRVGEPRILTYPLNSIRGPVTIESIRLARSVPGLTSTLGFTTTTCNLGLTDAAPLARCPLVAPRGVQVTPTSTGQIVISYRLTRPGMVNAPDVVVTYRSGGSTHSTALDLDVCLSAIDSPACTNI